MLANCISTVMNGSHCGISQFHDPLNMNAVLTSNESVCNLQLHFQRKDFIVCFFTSSSRCQNTSEYIFTCINHYKTFFVIGER
jgi:hypothetical protein